MTEASSPEAQASSQASSPEAQASSQASSPEASSPPASSPPASSPPASSPPASSAQADTPQGGTRAEQRRRTQARILDAAARMFAEVGFERATIRSIAAAAGVDAGLVMHYFGTKDELFRAVMRSGPGAPATGSPQEATEELLARVASSLATEPVLSLAMLRSMLTHPEAARAAGEELAEYRARLSAAIQEPDADLRAAMVTAVTLGVIVSRHMLKLDELADAPAEQVIELLAPCLRFLIGADEPAPDQPAPDEPAPDQPTPYEPAQDGPAPDAPAQDQPAPDPESPRN